MQRRLATPLRTLNAVEPCVAGSRVDRVDVPGGLSGPNPVGWNGMERLTF
jgi:hypothetical protein